MLLIAGIILESVSLAMTRIMSRERRCVFQLSTCVTQSTDLSAIDLALDINGDMVLDLG